MSLEATLTKKVGPLPIWVYLGAAVVIGVIAWKRYRGGGGGGADDSADGDGSDVSGPIASPDSGTFTGDNSLTVNGDTATMSSAGALLTGGFVGQPGGYQFSQPGGDVYVNVPTPKQVTNVITQKGPDKDKPPGPKKPPKSGHKSDHDKDDKKHPKKKSSSSKKKVTSSKSKSGGSGSDSNKLTGNRGGGVSINLAN
jgi:hypothetical protein